MGGGGSAGAAAAGALDDGGFSSKLTNVEAQRVMSVLQEMQRKVHLMGMIPEAVDRKVATIFPAETVAMLSEHINLNKRYSELREMKLSGEKVNEVDLKDAAKLLRLSTRTVARHFLQNPALYSKLRFLRVNKPPAAAQFEQLLHEVKMIVYERLMTTVEEERAKQDQLSIIIAKEQKTSNEVKALKAELDKARRERSSEISKRNEVIRRLKDELREIKQQAEETTKRMESRSKQKEDQEIQQAREKNREEEAQWRKKKFKIESEVENWIHKYDQDMEEKQAELEDITTIYMEEKAQLDELQQRYNDLQNEYDRIMEERRLAEEAKKEQDRQLRRMNDAATLIQAIFRGWKVRRDIKKKAAAKNEKKKKK
ncbi:IQ domain-containing protein D-like protein [Zopfochytrium polystomum]|nr:IQ domain-containing protein D-like protein [Zopfochytrium polystomum]